jgi:hypothetical protein
MAEAGGAFVTRSFKRLLNDAPGRKYNALQTALKAYLEKKPELTSASHHEEPAAAARDEMYVSFLLDIDFIVLFFCFFSS